MNINIVDIVFSEKTDNSTVKIYFECEEALDEEQSIKLNRHEQILDVYKEGVTFNIKSKIKVSMQNYCCYMPL